MVLLITFWISITAIGCTSQSTSDTATSNEDGRSANTPISSNANEKNDSATHPALSATTPLQDSFVNTNDSVGRLEYERQTETDLSTTPTDVASVSPQRSLAASNGPFPTRSLARDLTANQLVEFLAGADQDLQLILTGRAGLQTPEQIDSYVDRVIRLKREASRRLMDDATATSAQRNRGRRGYLQSLSHLAQLGDLEAANNLQSIAEQWKTDSDPDVSSDARMVLVGFAIERLEHGRSNAQSDLLAEVRDLVSKTNRPDVAALMTLGKARDTLQSLGHDDEAAEIEELIVSTFADHPDSNVVDMANQIVAASGNASPAIRHAESMREEMIASSESGTSVDPDAWRTMLTDLVDVAPTLTTSRFLAGLALETEAFDQKALATVSYQVINSRINDFDADGQRELTMALQARRNRESIIGQTFAPQLSSVDGKALDLRSFRNRVVLMPFWSSQYPQSLALLPELQAIVDRYAGDVVIVGMNLDTKEQDPASFMDREQLRFPSFRSISDPEAPIANPTAFEFGAVTLNFVAVIDSNGLVDSIHFSARDLAESVAKLIR
ncbi:MAG: TlpA disulfide reductase family protein [Planctomycetota bacterium]